jgi:hypothetical protein
MSLVPSPQAPWRTLDGNSTLPPLGWGAGFLTSNRISLTAGGIGLPSSILRDGKRFVIPCWYSSALRALRCIGLSMRRSSWSSGNLFTGDHASRSFQRAILFC